MHDRGGVVLTTGDIGIVNVLRQQLMYPGETIKAQIQGNVRLETLRERDGVPVNCRIDTFLTPLRWLWSDYPDWLREGPASTKSPTKTTAARPLDLLGIGNTTTANAYKFWTDAVLRIYNEYYKHPEIADRTTITTNQDLKAVPLPISWSRVKSSYAPDSNDDMQFTTPSNRNFDIRVLKEVENRYVAAMRREQLTYERWKAMLREMYDSNGSNEVDQVPFHVNQVSSNMSERDMPATDGPSLGKFQTIMDFGVNHRCGSISAAEHSILTYCMVLRYPSVNEAEGNPYHGVATVPYEALAGDPQLLRAERPEQVNLRHFQPGSATTNIGYLPAGWRHRTRWNHVDSKVRARQTFPIYNSMGSLANTREATRVNVAFRSTALQDYLADFNFTEMSMTLLPTASQSIMSGMAGKGDKRSYHLPSVK